VVDARYVLIIFLHYSPDRGFGASEISCVRTIWYLVVLITILQGLNVINRAGVVIALGNDEEVDARAFFSWHNSRKLGMLFLLIWIIKIVSMTILFYYKYSISHSCLDFILEYSVFWYAVGIQAIISFIVFSYLALKLCSFVIIYGHEIRHILDIEDSEPIPINYGIEMAVDGQTSEPRSRKSEVKKTDVESKACSICLVNEKTYACIPCGHMCLCELCAEDLSKTKLQGQDVVRCPICRLKLDNISRIYQ